MSAATMSKNFIFSSESVGEGHPDKVADYISDSILDACLEQDPKSRVACETLVKSNCVFLAGEITTNATLNYEAIVRQAIREIGYVNDDDVFHADKVFISNILTAQSSDIAQGVDAAAAEGKATEEQGAGDQGIMFGYACNQTPELMPAPVMYAHRLLREIAHQRKDVKVPWLRPDGKAQVTVEFEGDKPVRVHTVVVSTQHDPNVREGELLEVVTQKIIKLCQLCRADMKAGRWRGIGGAINFSGALQLLIDYVNRVRPGAIPWHYSSILTGRADDYLATLGYLDRASAEPITRDRLAAAPLR